MAMATRKKKTAKKAPSKEFEYVMSRLKRNPKLTFAQIKEDGAKKKLTIYPIVFGRAQALLGIVKSAKRGQGKAAQRSSAAAAGMRRGPGRPRKNAMPTSLEGLAQQIAQLQRDHDRAVDALERIRSILNEV